MYVGTVTLKIDSLNHSFSDVFEFRHNHEMLFL